MMLALVPLLVLIGIAVWVVKISRLGGGEQTMSRR
jgi:ABC-type transporter Mla subunit MlaD